MAQVMGPQSITLGGIQTEKFEKLTLFAQGGGGMNHCVYCISLLFTLDFEYCR
jgi:hypothetical protein